MYLNRNLLFIVSAIFVLLQSGSIGCSPHEKNSSDNIISYTINPASQNIAFYWKDDSGRIIKSLRNLKFFLERKNLELVFATNGGMYNAGHVPQGLFIQQRKTLTALDTSSGRGNFYLKPNGVFYITTENIPGICTTEEFTENAPVKFATQSGPMLVIKGQIHPAFKEGSANLNIRNGVGILPNNHIIFAMSKTTVNFYDFANYFKSLGCKNALYLDGFVSRTYLPEKNWMQTDGDFGVIIGVSRINIK